MRENDGRKLDHKTLEALRLRAVEQVNSGAHPEQVAEGLGLHRKTVYGWLAKYRDGGRGALLAKPVPGRPPRLPALQMRTLWTLIVGTDPRQMQFDFACRGPSIHAAITGAQVCIGQHPPSIAIQSQAWLVEPLGHLHSHVVHLRSDVQMHRIRWFEARLGTLHFRRGH